MSEENRFIKNKKVFALSISLVVACVLAGVFGISFVIVNDKYNDISGDYGDYNELYTNYLELLNDFNILNEQYSILTGEYIELENNYNALIIECDELLQDIVGLETTIADLNSQIIDLGEIIIGLEGEIIGLGNTITQLEDTIVQKDAIIVGLNTTIFDLNTQIVILTEERDALQIALDNLEDENEALILYYTELIAELNIQISTLTEERDALIIDLANMTALRDGLQVELDTMTLERDNLLIALNDMTAQRDALIIDLANMTTQRDNLQSDLDALQLQYDALLGDYQILYDAYNELQTIYNALQIAYDYITETIRQSILPVQYCIFAEAVRRYYKDIYIGGLSGKLYWKAFAEFCRDIVLHESFQENSFTDVSNAFSDALVFGNDTMYLAWYIMWLTFYPWLPNWDGFALTGDELTDIDTIVDWCIDEIDYEYDLNIIQGQEYFDWDYIKFPVETAFRTMGDCEDQAILTSAYLESCGFETAILISHDPNHPVYGEFYHGTLWVHIEDRNAFWSLYPDTLLWSIDDGTNLWYWVDTTWDVPFGSTPEWLQYYIDYNIPLSWDIITLAICDIGGFIGTNIGENLGLTCVMPT